MAHAAYDLGAGTQRPGIAPSHASAPPSIHSLPSISNRHQNPLENAATLAPSTNPPFLIDTDAPCFCRPSNAFYRSAVARPPRRTNYRFASHSTSLRLRPAQPPIAPSRWFTRLSRSAVACHRPASLPPAPPSRLEHHLALLTKFSNRHKPSRLKLPATLDASTNRTTLIVTFGDLSKISQGEKFHKLAHLTTAYPVRTYLLAFGGHS